MNILIYMFLNVIRIGNILWSYKPDNQYNLQMATSRQEKTYNEIIEYYNYADRLVRAAEDSSHKLAREQFVIVESVVDTLEKHADQLTTQYIEYVKNGESHQVIETVRITLNEIMEKIEECRSKIITLYQNSSENIN